jgi:peroxiredoxin
MPSAKSRLLLSLAIALIVGAAFAAGVLFTPRVPQDAGPGRLQAPSGGALPPAPDFRLRAFDGRPLALSDFRGKAVVLNFWASWCTPCREEMPNLERIHREFGDEGLVVLGISVLDDEPDARAFLTSLKVTYPNVFDPEQTRMRLYRVAALPTTILIDRSQRQRGRFVGGFVGEAGYQRLQEQVLALLDGRP